MFRKVILVVLALVLLAVAPTFVLGWIVFAYLVWRAWPRIVDDARSLFAWRPRGRTNVGGRL